MEKALQKCNFFRILYFIKNSCFKALCFTQHRFLIIAFAIFRVWAGCKIRHECKEWTIKNLLIVSDTRLQFSFSLFFTTLIWALSLTLTAYPFHFALIVRVVLSRVTGKCLLFEPYTRFLPSALRAPKVLVINSIDFPTFFPPFSFRKAWIGINMHFWKT